MLNNPFLAKVSRSMRSFNTSSQDLYNMEGFWSTHPQPAFYYLKDTDKYGKYEGFTYRGKSSQLNAALQSFGTRKMDDTFYEKFLGMIVLGQYNYSHKKFPSLRKLVAEASPEQWVRAESDLSKAILMNPYFEVYLRNNEHTLGDVAMKYIDSASKAEDVVYSKFFTALNGYGTFTKEIAGLATTPEEKLILAYAKNPLLTLKTGSAKVESLKNQVLEKFIELRPDIAYSQIPMECFLAANNEVKEKYLESLDKTKKTIMSSAGLWKNESVSPLLDEKANELRYKPSETLPNLLLNLRKFEPKMLKKVMMRASDFEKSVKNYSAEYLYTNDGGFKEEFKAIFKGTEFVKPFVNAVKGYPAHLQFDALFSDGNKSKEELLKEVAGNVKSSDITVALSKDPDFWLTYISGFKKNVGLQSEIVKKMTRLGGEDNERKVFNALVASDEPVATAYMLSVPFHSIAFEDRMKAVEQKIEKSVKNFEALPLVLMFKVSEKAKLLAVEGYQSQGDVEKAFNVMTQTKFFDKDGEDIKREAVKKFLNESAPLMEDQKTKTKARTAKP